MAITRSLKERLKNGETVFGTFYKMNSPIALEMLGWAGFDFIVADCEHSPIGYESVENIVRTAENVDLSAIVRVPSAAEEHIFHALDSGAVGVQIRWGTFSPAQTRRRTSMQASPMFQQSWSTDVMEGER